MYGTMMATLHVRLDGKLKHDAEEFFSSTRMDATDAVRMFLEHVVKRRAIPSEIVEEDPFYSPANQRRLDEAIRKAELGQYTERELIDV